MKGYNIYKIKESDTLQNIAKALNESPDDVARFHNIFASQDFLISSDFPENLKELFIKPDVSEKSLDNIPKVKFVYDNKLELKKLKTEIDYNVVINILTNERIFNINYKVKLKFISKIGENFIFELDKIKEKDPDFDIIQEVDFLVEKVIYPLQILVNEEGYLLEILNYKSILKRWKPLKKNILELFEGEIVEETLQQYENKILNEEIFKLLLKKDIFLNVFFNGIYSNYNNKFSIESTINFPVFPKINNLNFKVISKIDAFLTHENLISIDKNGSLEDNRTIQDLEHNLNKPQFAISSTNNFAKGNYAAKYLLNSNTNFIKKVIFSCEILLLDKHKIEVYINDQ
jgi:hypothetical protein